MGRIRLVALFFSLLGLLLSVPQEAEAQAVRGSGKNSPQKDDFSQDRRRGGHPPLPSPRKPEIFLCETPDTSCRTTQDTFPINELRDLFVFVVWPGVAGQHVQTVEFYLPEGSLYASRKTRFTVGASAPTTMMAPAFRDEVSPAPPAPHLMADANKVHSEGVPSLLMNSRGDSAILSVLPVGGTYITQRNLTGTWRVRVLLDDRIALQSGFTLIASPVALKLEELDKPSAKHEERDQP
jgi:hypothetical protein